MSRPETQLTQVIEHLPMPAAIIDDRGRIEALNQAWKDAARPGGIVADTDEPGSDYVHELRDEKGFNLEAGRRLAEVIGSVLKGARPSARETYEVEVDGVPARWEATVARLEDEEDVHVLVLHRDQTESSMAESMQAKVDALTVDRERGHAVHEDRLHLIHDAQQGFHGPMTPVRLQLYMLKAGKLGKLTKRQQASIDQVERNVQRLWDLQEKLLADLAALEDATGQRQATDLSTVLEEALQPFRERCIQAGVRLRVDRTDDPLPVHIDVRAIVQVLLVLLDRAIRTTPAGGMVWVRLRHVRGRAEIAIQDQDPTMDAEAAEALLDTDTVVEHPLRASLHHTRAVMEREDGDVSTHCAGAGQGLEVMLRVPLTS